MSVIFNSVTEFVESVGRRREHKSNANQLDTMDCVFTGPSALVDGFLPRDLAVHPVYPLMLCSGWSEVKKEGLVSELHVTYSGKINAGQSVVSTGTHEGSISWTTYSRTVAKLLQPAQYQQAPTTVDGVPVGVTIPNVPAVYSYAYLSISYVCRYVVSSTKSVYLSRTPVTSTVLGPDVPIPTNQQTYKTGASLSDNHLGLVTATLKFYNQTTIDCNDLGNGWFEITQTVAPTPYIDSTVFLQ